MCLLIEVHQLGRLRLLSREAMNFPFTLNFYNLMREKVHLSSLLKRKAFFPSVVTVCFVEEIIALC